MTELVPGDESPAIAVGEGNSQESISYQLAQAFYAEITGKSERITEDYSRSFVLSVSDIEQLHQRITQSTEQYNIASANEAFSIKYLKTSSERFSSIERFIAHAGSKGAPVEEIDIVYNLLVVLPKTNKPQEYKISVRLISRCAKVKRIKEDFIGMNFAAPLWQLDSKFTCRVTVDFVDVAVAHSFHAVVKNWVDCLTQTNPIGGIKYLRPFSKYLPAVCKYGLLIFGAYVTQKMLLPFFSSYAQYASAQFILGALFFNFLIYRFGFFVGNKAEDHLDQIFQISYINLSGSDEELARENKSGVTIGIIKAALYLASNIVVGIIATIISSKIISS